MQESAMTSAPQSTAASEPSFTIQIGGESLNLRDYPPLTHGDKKALLREPYNLNVKRMDEWGVDEEALFALFLLKRVRSTTTLAEIDGLPAKTVQDLVAHCLKKAAEVENPFSRPSTSSPANTAGGAKK